MPTSVRRTTALLVAGLLAGILPGAIPAASGAEPCPTPDQVTIPGAEFFEVTCLDDLTTLGNPRIDIFTYGWGGSGNRQNPTLNSDLTELPQEPVPGIQIDGRFPDSCSHYEVEHNSFIPSCPGGFRHNGQFLIRIPDDWDGVHLVVGGTPGVRTQFASDIILSDYVLTKGWAYATQDKGNTGLDFFRGGDDETDGSRTTWLPNVAIEQWATYMRAAVLAAEGALDSITGTTPTRTYAAGISNGGYQTRLAVERYPSLFDGGVDWEGTLFRPDAPNLYTYIPPLVRNYPTYRSSGDGDAYDALVHEGRLAPDSEPIWDHHYEIYWGAVQSTYRPVVDPEYTDYVAAPQLVIPPGNPDYDYDYASRPPVVRERVAALANTGDLHDRPFITVHGTLDALLPIAADSDVYAEMVRAQGQDDTYRYYVVERGEHVDPSADDHPETFRPILPCFWEAIDALDAWAVEGTDAPPSGFIPYDAAATPAERANTCALPGELDRVAGGDRVATAAEATRRTFGVIPTVVVATADDYPDALAAVPLAASVGGPVLLVGDHLSDETRRELHRTGALEAIVVGGPKAVSAEVVAELEAAGLTVRRVSGGDRFATAAAVARELGPTDEAFVVSGRGFADAVSAAPVAASLGAPILLVEPTGTVPAATRAALADLGVTRTTVVGGEGAVGAGVAAALPRPSRLSGPDRYATNAAVVEHALARGLALDEVYVATGGAFPDALSAGAVAAAGEWGAPPRGVVVLVDGGDASRSGPTLALLRRHAGAIERVLVFGGEKAVSASAAEAVRTAAR